MAKLLTQGVEGLLIIEEKRLKAENQKPIESLQDLEQREVIITNFSNLDTIQVSSINSAKAKTTIGQPNPLKELQNVVQKQKKESAFFLTTVEAMES